MQQTVVNIPSFQGEYKSGLVFSMIEGLRFGQSLKLICDQKPEELESLLRRASIPNLSWNTNQAKTGSWELLIEKKNIDESESSKVGCCGICGGHKD